MARPLAKNPLRQARRTRRRTLRLLSFAFLAVLLALIAAGVGLLLSLFSFRPPAPAQAAVAYTPPAPGLEQFASAPPPPGQTRILLLGSDQRPNDNGFRTDTIMLVSIDSDHNTVSVVSFPRDLWVTVPGLYEMKINQVQALGGFAATAAMFQANFGVRPDYYVLTNFSGFSGFIDRQGGVTVAVGQDLSDECSLPAAVNSLCSVQKGPTPMDGQTALWYIRSRHSSSDYDRLRRAQEVVFAVFKKLIDTISLEKLGELKSDLQNSIETNFSFEQALPFLPVAARVLQDPDAAIRRFAIDEQQAAPFWSWNGMWILLPDRAAIQGVLKDAGILR